METFPLFSRFPLEIRDLIWSHALPDRDAPAIFFYSQGFMKKFKKPYPPNHKLYPGSHLYLRFCHELLDPVPVIVPLLHVNADAARVVLRWAKKRNFNISKDIFSNRTMISRCMDRIHDILWLPASGFDTITKQLLHECRGDSLANRQCLMPKQYAISETEMEMVEWSASVFSRDDGFIHLQAETVYVLTTKTAVWMPEVENLGIVQPHRWVITPGNERALNYDFEKREFSWGPGDKCGGKEVWENMENMEHPLEEDPRKKFCMKVVNGHQELALPRVPRFT
ncbi:hypothetical protein VHEMI02981 [[Torrubiella] hemipterigena]|uniref:2EXR domain-containing protein n=1 Tax=[Torrubiella] hemipterigena TaxID=1531966 RepID=A0A0A1T9H3_9HYPO|nr:hypothetical protein VHEMI02981 [[Torrubiella] hemipterigena]